jgi:purine nucleosidase
MDLSTARAAAKGSRQRVVFLQDAAIDEYISTMLLTLMPGIDLAGVIIVNADCLAEQAMDAASRLQQFLRRKDIPIALSRARGWNAFPWDYRSDCIRFGEIPSLKEFKPEIKTPPPDGEELLVRLLENAISDKEPVTLLITGPLTPLQMVLEDNAGLAEGIASIVWMGGAIDVDGNLDPNTLPPAIANKHAEWNAFWDPYAVDYALKHFHNMHIFPLDISNTAPVKKEFLNSLQELGKTSRYAQLAFEAYSLVTKEEFYRLWDVTATCWLTRSDLYTAPRSTPLEIVTWGFEQGWIRPTASNGSSALSQQIYFSFSNLSGFYEYILQLLSAPAVQ